jgi:hypothetical protein
MLMDSGKHQSLSGEKANISNRVGGRFRAWDSHITGINLSAEAWREDRTGVA